MDEKKIALVTGANRGIGREVCRQLAEKEFIVILGSRDLVKGTEAAREIQTNKNGQIFAKQLDVTDDQSIAALAEWMSGEFGRLDVLVNNAGILYDSWETVLTADFKTVHEAFETNVLGAWRMAKAFAPLIKKSALGRIVNVSSEAGSLASMGSGTPAYSASKAALNALTKMLAVELRNDNILVNSVCPGWVATDMGGSGGRPVAEGAASIVWAATLPEGSTVTGGFYRDGKPLAW